MQTTTEHRTENRSKLSWPVSIWMPEANRFFNGKSSNISKSGVLLSVPMTTPVSEGHAVEINFPRTEALAKQKGGYSRIKSGKVVRVDRDSILQDAHVSVAVHFD